MEIHYHVDLLTTVGTSKQNQCQMVSQFSVFFCFLLLPCVIKKEKHNAETQRQVPSESIILFTFKAKKVSLKPQSSKLLTE